MLILIGIPYVQNLLRVAALGLAIVVLFHGPSIAETYRLAAGDKVLIRAGNWSFTEQIYKEWAGVSGEYAVGGDGAISVALAGRLIAQSKTADELSAEIGNLLQVRIGLPVAPTVAVEVSAYRPVFVSGEVDQQGAHPYTLGLTVGQALALAGGRPRAVTFGVSSSTQVIDLQGELEGISTGIKSLAAQESRLIAEISSYERQDAASDISLTPMEQNLKDANQTAIVSQQEGLRTLQQLLDEQILRLDQEMALVDGQVTTITEELGRMATLQERGLVNSSRVSVLENSIANLETRRLQVEVARLTAEQQRNTARREEAGILDQARLRRLTELKETSEKLAALRIRFATTQALLHENLASEAAPGLAGSVLPPPIYRIKRLTDGATDAFIATADTPMKPGDLLEVIQPPALPPTE